MGFSFPFWSIWCSVCFCICMGVPYLSMGKFSSKILKSALSVLWNWQYSPSSMPIIWRFGFFSDVPHFLYAPSLCFCKIFIFLACLTLSLFFISVFWCSFFWCSHSTYEAFPWVFYFNYWIFILVWVLLNICISWLNSVLRSKAVFVIFTNLMFVCSWASLKHLFSFSSVSLTLMTISFCLFIFLEFSTEVYDCHFKLCVLVLGFIYIVLINKLLSRSGRFWRESTDLIFYND